MMVGRINAGPWMFGLVLAGALVLGGCGDKFGLGGFPRIQVLVDSDTIDESGTVQIPQSIQTSVDKVLEIINPGNRDLMIEGIDWETDPDTGARIKNKYIEIDWRGAIGPDSFPYELIPDSFSGLTIAVRFTPPLGLPLDDFRDSTLIIRSNARSVDGERLVEEVRVTFSLQQDIAVPRVTPTNYTFTNATPAKPERQDFTIYNDEQQATASFGVTSVALESPSSEWQLLNAPSSGAVVLAPGDPGYQPIVFTIEYRPQDETPDTNAILITTDVAGTGTLRVNLSTNLITGSYSLSYSNPSAFDFTNVTTRETRSVVLVSEGPGPLTVKAPRIDPAEAQEDYTLTAWLPATSAEGQDTEIVSWPRGLQVGRSIRFDVEYAPANDGTDTANGQLIIPYDAPDPDQVVIDLFSGDPKSKIVLAPATGNVFVSGDTAGGDTGARSVIIYNEGNGPLNLVAMEVTANFGLEPAVYDLVSAFSPTVVPPGGLHVVELAYDLGGVPDVDSTVSEFLTVTYFNDFTNQNEEKTFGLIAADDAGLEAPVADPGAAADYAGAVAGEAVTLSGAGSTAGGGAFGNNPYIWYLTSRPDGSGARLNLQGGVTAAFVPDVAGSYTVELVVFSQSGDTYLYSEPVEVTFTVGGP